MIDALILGVSALLLLMAWSNAAATILMAVWTVLRIMARLLAKCLGAPMRWISRHLYSLATRLRERHRDKIFTAELSASPRSDPSPVLCS